MLIRLHIENIAIIENIDISFDNGFSVLTGETGAGKSILIDSINILLGNRASKNIIRRDCERASISATFENLSTDVIKLLKEYGLFSEDYLLIIQRDIYIDGKSFSRINGKQITINILRDIGKLLISFHGQHENNNLLDKDKHVDYLDTYSKNFKIKKEYIDIFNRVKQLKNILNSYYIDEKDKTYNKELLAYQIEEIENAKLVCLYDNTNEDEEVILQKKRSLILSQTKIIEALDDIKENLSGENNSVKELIYKSIKNIIPISDYDERINDFSIQLNEIYENISALGDDIRDFRFSVFSDSNYMDITDIEERLDLIYRLKRKYGNNIAEILKYCEECKLELGKIESSFEEIERIKLELDKLKKTLEKKAEKLTNSRKVAALELEEKIVDNLKYLDMPNVKIACCIKDSDYTINGKDSVEFLLSANIGENLKPLSKISSGGELSRIMLSIKNVFSNIENVPTLIFDEIDTGVSGKAAHKIAVKLWEMAKERQVIVVTHLTQIAAMGDYHYLINKTTKEGRTFVEVKSLEFDERKKELARIISGTDISEGIISTAEEILKNSEKLKSKK